jgi:hypothetical protein
VKESISGCPMLLSGSNSKEREREREGGRERERENTLHMSCDYFRNLYIEEASIFFRHWCSQMAPFHFYILLMV